MAMAEKRLGIIMNGTEDENARAARPVGTQRPATPMPALDKGAK
jgi:hypothetical protein